MTTTPEPTMADRALFVKLFGVLPSNSPIDQKALRDLAAHRTNTIDREQLADAIVVELCRQSESQRAGYLYVGERSIGVPDELLVDGEINLEALAGAISEAMA
ncbi:hypothetical protein LAV_00189 [Sphingobium phage Lacusarx]|uniref:Uncharacterized protein n=1 Tax=Sphingobium phage Lacusarx TaxID=1980139 RepID=A0A1W6DXC3_9CAUD|nr:hypothetical protein FDH44_gp114 [Sphingobium phage Lacusarx]ARK07564.1 hypothetical protein LAV_00189 [Sphingobium phage Lacusarx]